MQDALKAVWSIPFVSRFSKVSWCPDCIFEIHQLWQSGFSRVYSNSSCSCSFEPEIIKIGQLSRKMYSNNILNFQEPTINRTYSAKSVIPANLLSFYGRGQCFYYSFKAKHFLSLLLFSLYHLSFPISFFSSLVCMEHTVRIQLTHSIHWLERDTKSLYSLCQLVPCLVSIESIHSFLLLFLFLFTFPFFFFFHSFFFFFFFRCFFDFF